MTEYCYEVPVTLQMTLTTDKPIENVEGYVAAMIQRRRISRAPYIATSFSMVIDGIEGELVHDLVQDVTTIGDRAD